MSLHNLNIFIVDPIDQIEDFGIVINTLIAVSFKSHGYIILIHMGSLVFLEVPVLILPVIVNVLEGTSQECRQVVNLIRSQVVLIKIQE